MASDKDQMKVSGCFKHETNYAIFKSLYTETRLKNEKLEDIFIKYIDKIEELDFCVSEYDQSDVNRDALGYVRFVGVNKKNIVKFDDENDVIAFRGFNISTVTHEMIHVTQVSYEYLLDNNPANWTLYTKNARDEVEVRLIMFYLAFIKATPEVQKDRTLFENYLKLYWNVPEGYTTYLPLLGHFYDSDSKSDNGYYFYNNTLNTFNKDEIYQIVYEFMMNKQNNIIDKANQLQFKNVIIEYSKWLYKNQYKDKEKSDFMNFDGYTPLFNLF